MTVDLTLNPCFFENQVEPVRSHTVVGSNLRNGQGILAVKDSIDVPFDRRKVRDHLLLLFNLCFQCYPLACFIAQGADRGRIVRRTGFLHSSCPKIPVDELPLYLPRKIVGKGLCKHEVARFSHENDGFRCPALGALNTKPTNFVGLVNNIEVFSFDEPFPIRSEIPACGSFRPTVYRVDILKGHDTLASILLDCDFDVADRLEFHAVPPLKNISLNPP